MDIKIGLRIKELRKRKNMTQEQLAEALGITGQAISKWESGNGYPDITYIMPIAKYFNVATDYLLENKNVSLLDIKDKDDENQYYCSFCNKESKQAKSLVAEPGSVNICSECVGVCVNVLIDK